MIQTTSLEKRTGKSLWNSDNPTNNNLTQYDANVTNNMKNVVSCPNELRQSLYTNVLLIEIQSATHEDM